jgi:hypothetical protein
VVTSLKFTPSPVDVGEPQEMSPSEMFADDTGVQEMDFFLYELDPDGFWFWSVPFDK